MKSTTPPCVVETFVRRILDADHRIRRIRPPQSGDGAPVVFLHEGLGRIEIWKDFPEAVCAAAGREGLIYDRRGYGGSAPYPAPVWPNDYLETETRYLPALLDALDIDRAILVGHSDGASIALLAAAMAPERIAGVFSEAAHIFVEEATRAGIREAVSAYEAGRLAEKLARFHGADTEAVFRRWADTWLAPRFQDWNMEAFLPGILCPLMAIQGADDPYATPEQLRGIARGVSGPVRTRRLPDCGHIPHFQARGATMDLLLEFLREF